MDSDDMRSLEEYETADSFARTLAALARELRPDLQVPGLDLRVAALHAGAQALHDAAEVARTRGRLAALRVAAVSLPFGAPPEIAPATPPAEPERIALRETYERNKDIPQVRALSFAYGTALAALWGAARALEAIDEPCWAERMTARVRDLEDQARRHIDAVAERERGQKPS